MSLRPTYLFDTNAVRGLPRADLLSLARDNRAVVSPYVLYELATQLDLTDDSAYRRSRGNFLKADALELLEDPHLAIAGELGIAHRASPRAAAHYQLIRALVEQLKGTEDLASFEKAVIVRDDGVRFPCPGYVRMVGAWLRDVERHHLAHLEQHRRTFRSLLAEDPGFELDTRFLIRLAMGSSVRSGEVMREYGALEPRPDGVMFFRSFLYLAYNAFQALRGARAPDLRFDPNDAEDAALLLHLDLRQKWVWVSSERRISDALEFAVTRLTLALKSLGVGDVPSIRWLTADQLRAVAP